MKSIITLLFCGFLSTQAFAQIDTLTIEQYCTVVATPRMLSTKVTIDIDYGEKRRLWKDNRLKDEEGKLRKFNTVIDALNYMGQEGWKLVNAFPVSTSSTTITYHYVFRKHFLRSEVTETD
jgi:hypothetical protein